MKSLQNKYSLAFYTPETWKEKIERKDILKMTYVIVIGLASPKYAKRISRLVAQGYNDHVV